MSKKTYTFGPLGSPIDLNNIRPKPPEPQKIRIALGPVDTEMATRPPCNRCKHGEDKTERQECWECPRPVTQYQNYEPK